MPARQRPNEPSFWLSMNTYSSSFTKDHRPNAHTSIFSIILDGQAHLFFSGIRLLIVYNEGSSFNDLAIDDCSGPKRPKGLSFEAKRPQPTIPRFKTRNWLNRRRSSVSQHARPDLSITTGREPLPVCTILCYLSVLLPGTPPVFELGSELGLRLAMANSKIGFDRTYLCDSDNHTILLYLQCCSASIGDPSLSPRVPNRIPVQEVRVLPITHSRLTFPKLPISIIRLITEFCINRTSARWRSRLLNLALVQRSWLPLIELFFEGIGGDTSVRIGGPQPIARSLQRHPELARFIQNFRTTDFGDMRYNYDFPREEDRRALGYILKLASNTRLCDISRPLFRSLAPSLRYLRGVERFTLFKPFPFDLTVNDDVTFDDILDAMTGWTRLRRLSIIRWNRCNIPASSHQSIQRTPYNKLEMLELKSGHLLPSQFGLFISPTAPALRSLALHDIIGLSNQDLRDFLSLAAPTVDTILITKSSFPKSSPDEELAFEATLPSMRRLTIVEIAGSLITPAALTRKIESPTEMEDELMANCSIYVHHPTASFLKGLTDALKVTHWKSISMHGPSVQSWDAEYARAVASLRDIFLFVSTRPGWWVSEQI